MSNSENQTPNSKNATPKLKAFPYHSGNAFYTDYSVINDFTTETMSSCMTKVASLS